MICVMCKTGETAPGTVTRSLYRDANVVIVKDVPAQVCAQCGEPYFDGEVVGVMEQLLGDAVRSGIEVQILRYAA